MAEVDPSRVDVFCRAVVHELIPRFLARPDAASGHWMLDRARGNVLVLTTWHGDGAVAATWSGDRALRANVAERTALITGAIRYMEVVDADDAGLTPLPASRRAFARWISGGAPEVEWDREALPGFVGRYRLVDPDVGDALELRFLVAGDTEPGGLESIDVAACAAASAR